MYVAYLVFILFKNVVPSFSETINFTGEITENFSEHLSEFGAYSSLQEEAENIKSHGSSRQPLITDNESSEDEEIKFYFRNELALEFDKTELEPKNEFIFSKEELNSEIKNFMGLLKLKGSLIKKKGEMVRIKGEYANIISEYEIKKQELIKKTRDKVSLLFQANYKINKCLMEMDSLKYDMEIAIDELKVVRLKKENCLKNKTLLDLELNGFYEDEKCDKAIKQLMDKIECFATKIQKSGENAEQYKNEIDISYFDSEMLKKEIKKCQISIQNCEFTMEANDEEISILNDEIQSLQNEIDQCGFRFLEL